MVYGVYAIKKLYKWFMVFCNYEINGINDDIIICFNDIY